MRQDGPRQQSKARRTSTMPPRGRNVPKLGTSRERNRTRWSHEVFQDGDRGGQVFDNQDAICGNNGFDELILSRRRRGPNKRDGAIHISTRSDLIWGKPVGENAPNLQVSGRQRDRLRGTSGGQSLLGCRLSAQSNVRGTCETKCNI